jgi:two-component system phosphate regulon sensor histidine kinase PhoR
MPAAARASERREPRRPIVAGERAPPGETWHACPVAVSRSKNRQRLGYRRIVQLLVYLIIVPTVLLLAVGIVLLFTGEAQLNLLLGLLILSFVSVLVTGVVLVLVFIRREANLSELQADFVSKVSHELRTPLTAIRLFAETMQRARGDESTQERCLALLGIETERLTGRIERLLDWGRMEAGRKLFDIRGESVQTLVDESLAAFSPLRYADDLVLTSEVDGSLPAISADRHAIVDVLVNLLSNAQKYGGSPPIVGLRAYATDHGEVCFEVRDNGDGIARPEHRRIFEKFYRIDDRFSRTREGSGLGLAIVKHIVRAHRGRILVDSAKGRGSTFRLFLPVADPVDVPEHAAPRVAEGSPHPLALDDRER